MADLYRDFVFTRNTVPVTDLDTSIQVEDVSLFPSNEMLKKGEFFLAFDSTLAYPPSFEIVRLTSIDVPTKTLSVVRGQAGTKAVGHAIVTYIKGTLNSDQVRRVRTGFFGTTAPAPDAAVFSAGDRFYHSSEGRFYAFTGNAAFLKDSFGRAASTTTMGSTEIQTVIGEVNGVLPPQYSQVVPYQAPWVPNAANIFGINASNQAYLVSGVAGATSLLNVGSTNFDISFDAFMSTTATSDYGIFFRVDTESKYGYYLQFLGTTASLFRCVDGVFTAIVGATVTYTAGAICTWRVVADGNVIRVFRTNPTGVSELGINYTETTAGFTVGSTPYRVGAHVGIRYGNAAAVGDTAIAWDAFSSTTPDNVGLNNPKAQGWAPTSSLVGPLDTSGFTLRQLQRVESDVQAVVNQTDDLTQALVSVDNAVGGHSADLVKIAYNFDETLEVLRDLPDGVDTQGALAVTAGMVDDIIDILQTLVRTGNGEPVGAPRDAEVYIDKASKVIWTGIDGAWRQVTFSGPGVAVTTPTYVDGYTIGKSSGLTFTVPSTAQVGDLCFVQVSTVNTGTVPTVPNGGWTLLASGAFAPYNWHTYGFAYKVVQAADIGASYTFGGTQTDYTQQVRVYRGASFRTAMLNYVATTAPSGAQTVSGPTVTTTRDNCLVVTWFALDIYNQNNFTLLSQQSNPLVTSDYSNHMSQGSQDEYLTLAGTTVVRQFSYTDAWSTVGYSALTMALEPIGKNDLGPAASTGTGVPILTGRPTGSLYVDLNSKAVYLYDGTGWVGVTPRVVRTRGDYTAKGNDYILADTTASGRSSLNATFDVSTYKIDTADPSTTSLTSTLADTYFIGVRASWGTAGWTATLDGTVMTRARRQAAGTYSLSDLFVSTAPVAAGAHSVVFSGATQHGIAWASALAIRGIDPAIAAYTGASYTNNLSIALPAGPGGIVVLYSQVNGGTVPSITGTGGLTWTDRGGQAHGSQNASRWWTGTYTAAQAGTTVSITTSPNDTSYGHIQAAVFPSAGDPNVFDAANYSVITLPSGLVGARVAVQSDDTASNEIRVVPASGLINGADADYLTTRYQSMQYISDGTNWFADTPKQSAVLRKSTNYTAHDSEVILVDATAANRLVTLPLAIRNRTVSVKKIDASTNLVSVTGAGATPQTIDGASSVTLTAQYETQTYVADGTSWWRTR